MFKKNKAKVLFRRRDIESIRRSDLSIIAFVTAALEAGELARRETFSAGVWVPAFAAATAASLNISVLTRVRAESRMP